VAVAPVVARIAGALARTPAGQALAWRQEVPPGLAAAVEEGDLVELLGALLENAAKWARTEVRVAARVEGGSLLLLIEDDGPGIRPQDRRAALTRGVRLDPERSGTGLGLATVHGIIHQTGGNINVDSTLGKGTVFTVYIPRHTETAEDKKQEVVSEEKASISDLTGSSKILLVEDEDAVRTFSARALSNKGYQVIDAPGGHEALRLLAESKSAPELLITDVMMPEMDGTTLAKQVKAQYPDIKIVFISGYAEDKFKEHLGTHVWFLPKPFTLKQLALKVKEVLGEEG
jgi:two-component system cell cycle sensor histidine kinase/response regulator CckA